MDNEGKMTARKVKNARLTAGASTICVARQGYVAFFDLPPANKTEKQHGSSPVFCRRERKKRSGKEERKNGAAGERLAWQRVLCACLPFNLLLSKQ